MDWIEYLTSDQGARAYLEHSDEYLVNVHPASQCEGENCTIHNRSAHNMRHMRQHWRGDRFMMERICEHGVGHPDPDEIVSVDRTHGCCGCCGVTPW